AVEDSEDDAILLRSELRRGGFEPTIERVESAVAMREALTRERWDVVVADSSLPQFNALSALAVLKQSGQDLPFLIVSGSITEEEVVAALKAGAQDYVVKSRLARLVPAIERELREAEARHQRRAAGPEVPGALPTPDF